jgi:predicted HTH transcriptional regulator
MEISGPRGLANVKSLTGGIVSEVVDLAFLVHRPEGETIDFKATNYPLSESRKKRDFAKDVASLANTPRDGNAYIVLGVKKHLDGTFELWGIENEIDDAQLQSVASSLLEELRWTRNFGQVAK